MQTVAQCRCAQVTINDGDKEEENGSQKRALQPSNIITNAFEIRLSCLKCTNKYNLTLSLERGLERARNRIVQRFSFLSPAKPNLIFNFYSLLFLFSFFFLVPLFGCRCCAASFSAIFHRPLQTLALLPVKVSACKDSKRHNGNC